MSFIPFKYILFLVFISNLCHSQATFPCGVASGDPLTDAVIIWTTIEPQVRDSLLTGVYQIAKDVNFKSELITANYTTTKKNNHCVKIDVKNLTPNTWYYYRFIYRNDTSIIGRTKTAPTNNDNPTNFAVVSCSNYEHGYFNVYKNITEQNNVDAIIHLGDYIYEMPTRVYSANMPDRITYPLHEIITQQDYSDRYRHYRKDEDLQKLHQNFPFITIWDDHEIANDSYTEGAANHDSTEGDYHKRLANAKRAYYNWMPIREQSNNKIYRTFSYGKHINLLFLDTRTEGRDEQTSRKKKYIRDTTRRLIGDEQFNWLTAQLSSDTGTWNILAQQVMIAPFKLAGVIGNPDQWDGYQFEKDRLFNHIQEKKIKNIVVLTGDLHSAWANDLPLKKYRRKGKNSLGVEFITPSITSARGIPIPAWSVKMFNKHIKYLNLKEHGYINLSINDKKIQADFNFVSTILSKSYTPVSGPSFEVLKGSSHLQKVSKPKAAIATNPPLINY